VYLSRPFDPDKKASVLFNFSALLMRCASCFFNARAIKTHNKIVIVIMADKIQISVVVKFTLQIRLRLIQMLFLLLQFPIAFADHYSPLLFDSIVSNTGHQ
jgi:hypothetical protein